MKYSAVNNPTNSLIEHLETLNKSCYILNEQQNYLIIDLPELGSTNYSTLLETFPDIKFSEFDKRDLSIPVNPPLKNISQNTYKMPDLYLINDAGNLQVSTFDEIVFETSNVLESFYSSDGKYLIIRKDSSISIYSEGCELFNHFFLEARECSVLDNLLIIRGEDLLQVVDIETSDVVHSQSIEDVDIQHYIFRGAVVIGDRVVHTNHQVSNLADLLNRVDTKDITDSRENSEVVFGETSYLIKRGIHFKYITNTNTETERTYTNLSNSKAWFEKDTLFVKLERTIKNRTIHSLEIFINNRTFSIPLCETDEIHSSSKYICITNEDSTKIYCISRFVSKVIERESRAVDVSFIKNNIFILYGGYFEIYNNNLLVHEQTCLAGNKLSVSPNNLFICISNMRYMCSGAFEIYDFNGFMIRKMSVTGLKCFEWRPFKYLSNSSKEEVDEGYVELSKGFERREFGDDGNKDIGKLRREWVQFLERQREKLLLVF